MMKFEVGEIAKAVWGKLGPINKLVEIESGKVWLPDHADIRESNHPDYYSYGYHVSEIGRTYKAWAPESWLRKLPPPEDVEEEEREKVLVR